MKLDVYKTDIPEKARKDTILSLITFFETPFFLISAILGCLYFFMEEEKYLGYFLIILPVSLFLLSLRYFKEEKIKKVPFPPEESDNLAEFLSFDIAKTLLKRRPQNGNEFIYYILKDYPDFSFIFHRCLVSFKKIKKVFKKTEGGEEIAPVIESALDVSLKRGKKLIDEGDVLIALAKSNKLFKEVMIQADLQQKDIENLVSWLEFLKEKKRKIAEKRGALGKKWVVGYSLTLDKYSANITEKIRSHVEFISHKEEVDILERALIKNEKSNALIVGEPGSGRKSIVYNLAQRSLYGRSLPVINYRRVIELNTESLLAKIQSQEELESVLDDIFREAVFAGDVILVINNIHEYVGEAKKLGAVDITGIMVPYLNMSNFQVVGITDYRGLHERIEKNSSFLGFFEKIEISEVPVEQVLKILQTIVPSLERKYKVFISYPALKSIVDLCERYLPNLSFPEKGIELLEEVVLYVSSLKKEKTILSKHVAKVISEKTEIPIGEIGGKEKEILLNLEELIHQRIINQEEAVKEISTALRRARSEITTKSGPMGAFLFLGPTGVGKTETAKALADIYFRSEEKIVRLDMSEFQEVKDIARLIGSSEETGLLTSPVKETPFSLLLLDEIEKAHPNILNLFLQVLDEGHVTDGIGRKIDFRNTIIIATSNAGYEIILENIEKNKDWKDVKELLLSHIFKNNIFKPEFVNRFDAAVIFSPLKKESLLRISDLILSNLKNNLREKGIEFLINEELKEKIVELSYNPKFGAREMRRIIQDKVENKLAYMFLSGEIKKGDKVAMDSEFNVKK